MTEDVEATGDAATPPTAAAEAPAAAQDEGAEAARASVAQDAEVFLSAVDDHGEASR